MNSNQPLHRTARSFARRVGPPALLAGLLCALAPAARSADFEFKAAAFTAGGGTATNAAFRLIAAFPGSAAGPAGGGNFTLAGRFPGIRLVQTPGAPRLGISASAAGFVLQWPAAFPGFRLQTTASLTEPQWSDVPSPVLVLGEQNTVTVPAAAGSSMSFYRLVRP